MEDNKLGFKTYKITDVNGAVLPFVINDVMGLEGSEENGIHPDDIIKALKGHVKEGYTFNPVSPLNTDNPDYIKEPSPNDKVHCLVTVMAADSISLLDKEAFQKMIRVRKEALSLEFEKPWRKMPWGSKDILEEKLRNFEPSTPDAEFVRILIVGEIGVGKSSFINSVNNAFQKRITCGALVDVEGGHSFTKIFKTHYIMGKNGSNLPFVFNDIMGLEYEDEHGARVQDIISALKGCLKEGYKFNPATAASKNDHNYKKNPKVSDQTFCVVYVITAHKVSFMRKEVIQKLRMIREEASKYNLPQVIIMTNVDRACPLVQKDLRKIYTSKKIKEKMQECSNLLGVPMCNIFPVKNYHDEVDTDNYIDVLILKALDQIVNLANDALVEQTSSHMHE
ncbi:interferon-induced protein 44 isoform X3 [Silurus meridionalis]|nr:interferon-induced protein 44 isoform X3 [Silurus meridionalis]